MQLIRCSPLSFCVLSMNYLTVIAFLSWLCGGWAITKFIDPAALQLYVVLTVFTLIIVNLGERRHGRSAYSVFNENCQPLMGQISADQFDNELRHRNNTNDSVSPSSSRSEQNDHATLLETTRKEILAEQRKARRVMRVTERPRRRR